MPLCGSTGFWRWGLKGACVIDIRESVLDAVRPFTAPVSRPVLTVDALDSFNFKVIWILQPTTMLQQILRRLYCVLLFFLDHRRDCLESWRPGLSYKRLISTEDQTL